VVVARRLQHDRIGILRGMAPDRLDPDFVDAFEASLAPPQAMRGGAFPAKGGRIVAAGDKRLHAAALALLNS
jgi:hypothetical protein